MKAPETGKSAVRFILSSLVLSAIILLWTVGLLFLPWDAIFLYSWLSALLLYLLLSVVFGPFFYLLLLRLGFPPDLKSIALRWAPSVLLAILASLVMLAYLADAELARCLEQGNEAFRCGHLGFSTNMLILSLVILVPAFLLGPHNPLFLLFGKWLLDRFHLFPPRSKAV